jgi:hypothetical protein
MHPLHKGPHFMLRLQATTSLGTTYCSRSGQWSGLPQGLPIVYSLSSFHVLAKYSKSRQPAGKDP